MKGALISLAETMPIILDSSSRNGRVAEPVVPIHIEAPALAQIVSPRIKSVVESALRNLGICGSAAIIPVFVVPTSSNS